GIRFYSNLIDSLLEHGIIPFVTIYHWDLPQALLDRYGGWLNKDEIVQDYVRYARVCFEAFGDRVKHWLTMNEPWCISVLGYGRGVFAPGRSSDRKRSPEGDSSTEPWIVGHNAILSHAYAVELYRKEFKPTQKGQIGITLNGDWAIPYDDTPQNAEAAQHALDVAIGWFADPIYLGHYPEYMKQMLRDRLPEFTPEEWLVVKGSSDFYGMNTYTTNLCSELLFDVIEKYSQAMNQRVSLPKELAAATSSRDSWTIHSPDLMVHNWARKPIVPGSKITLTVLASPDPRGFRDLLNYAWKRYKLPVYVTENGFAVKDENSKPIAEALQDHDRVNYFKGTTAASYRFSISWSRIIPLGGRNDPVNPRGIQFYSNLINSLLEHGIIPFVRYKLPIYVTENGFAVKDENSKPIAEALQDHDRVNYFKGTTAAVKAAVLEDGVDIRA
ncbi:glycoside hydrolase family 1 protein, partial [Paxillus involutus ATCC 200175]